jgi:hypothetical protein
MVSYSPVAASPPPKSTPTILRVVRKLFPAYFPFFRSCTKHRRSPTVGRPPPWMSCLGRHPNHQCERMIEFTIALAMRRCNPRVIPWPGALFLPTPATSLPRAAGSGVPAAAQPHAHVVSRTIWHGWPRSARPARQTGLIQANRGKILKEPLSVFNFTRRSFHLKETLQSSPLFYVLAPFLIRSLHLRSSHALL